MLYINSPAVGTHAAIKKGTFGTSRWQLCSEDTLFAGVCEGALVPLP